MRRKGIIVISLCALLGLLSACGDGISVKIDVDTKNNSTETQASDDNEQTTEATQDEAADEGSTDSEPQVSENESVDFHSITEEQCRVEIESLRGTEPVNTDKGEILTEMARCATFAMILDEKGSIFTAMDSSKRYALRCQIYKALMWGENVFTGTAPIEEGGADFETDQAIAVSEAVAVFNDIYGEEDFTAGEYEERIKDGYVLLSFGDGDPGEYIEHMQFFEDNNYYLLTGPAFYGDNGGRTEYRGYADILFAKNPDSRYGVTMIYGRYRNEEVNVSSVDTSSELPDANGKSYSGWNLVDGKLETAWVEGVDGLGIGETITLHLDKEQKVYGIMLFNGYLADYDLFEKNGKVTEVSVDFGNGNVIDGKTGGFGYEDISPSDLASCSLNKIELDSPIMTDTITITITDAEAGYKYDDICISEIKVY